jgi:hypothetical protein
MGGILSLMKCRGARWALINCALIIAGAAVALAPWGRESHAMSASGSTGACQREEGADVGPSTGPVAAGAFDLAQLNPSVRAAVERARDAERRALSAAQRAQAGAQRALDAVRRADTGEAGYRSYDYQQGDESRHYAGGWSNDTRNGYGVEDSTAGPFAGDRYAGFWSDGGYGGVGVYNYARNSNNRSDSLRYEGEWNNDRRNGVGVMTWRDNDRFAGTYRDGVPSGVGVYRFADGFRYEGEFANDNYSGYGVLWDSQGRVRQAGVWANDSLATPLGPQGPQ